MTEQAQTDADMGGSAGKLPLPQAGWGEVMQAVQVLAPWAGR